MKKLIPSAVIGYIGGILGSLIFQPIDSLMDIIASDFSIGGIIIGLVIGWKGFDQFTLKKLLLSGVGVGLVVFLIFGLLSGHLIDDLIAGTFIGIMVGLVNHYLGKKIKTKVNDIVD